MKLYLFILFLPFLTWANGDDRIMQRKEEDKRRYNIGVNSVFRHRNGHSYNENQSWPSGYSPYFGRGDKEMALLRMLCCCTVACGMMVVETMTKYKAE